MSDQPVAKIFFATKFKFIYVKRESVKKWQSMEQINLDPKELFTQGIMIEKSIPSKEVIELIQSIKCNYESVELIRIGGLGDGGYLFPDIFADVDYCFSPGVNNIASFEEHLASEYNVKSFLADASVDHPPLENNKFHFTKKFLGSEVCDEFITLSTWMKRVGMEGKSDLFLQMDIEGFELDVLIKEDLKILNKFAGMIIEFHWLQKIFDPFTFKMFKAIFSKLFEEFCIVHIHPNNCCGIATYDNVSIPRVAEFSFLRRDYLKKVNRLSDLSLPNKLDNPNLIHNDDIILPSIWWKKQGTNFIKILEGTYSVIHIIIEALLCNCVLIFYNCGMVWRYPGRLLLLKKL